MCPLTPSGVADAQPCPSDGCSRTLKQTGHRRAGRESRQGFSEVMLLWMSRFEAPHLSAGLWEFSEWHKGGAV